MKSTEHITDLLNFKKDKQNAESLDEKIDPNANPSLEDESISKLFNNFAKDLIKYFGIRAAFILSKFLLTKVVNQSYFKVLLSLASLRSVLCFSSLPLLYKLFKKVFGNKEIGVFISGFLSGFIAINFEEKTNLVQFLILSVFARCLHATFLKQNKDINFDLPWKLLEFILFTVINTTLISLSFLIPHFDKIRDLVDNHNCKTITETYEIDHIRKIIKLV